MNKIIENLKQHLAIIMALLVCAIWGETFVSSKILLEDGLMPSDIFFYRFVLGYVCIWAFSYKRLWADNWQDELLLLVLGIMGGSLYFLTENMALMFSTASNVAILVGSTPLITAVLLALFYKDERMCTRQMVGSLLAFGGMALVILNGQLMLHLNPKGDILALCASLTWACYSLIIKKLSRHYNTLFITRKIFVYGILTVLPYLWIECPLQTDLAVLSKPAVWVNLLYLGVVASMLCFVAWNWTLKQLGTVRATNIIYLQSFFTMFFSYVILDERITLMAICGTATLIMGMYLAGKSAS
ncbi:MAG: DMT family transporter [Bacteroidaceae bacterium]|nr:DMT family transporter [Bacteroidaceae bacterium]